jgi:hypothetical protein
MKNLLALGLLAVVVVGCSPDPVPTVDDPRNIVVDGQSMTPQAFVEKYCSDKAGHETCIKVRRAMVADATKSKNGAARF